MNHFLDIGDATDEELARALARARQLREEREAGRPRRDVLEGRSLALLFEKPSLRTRVSFEQAMYELGGDALVLTGDEVGLGGREPTADIARVLGGMVHALTARVFDHATLRELANHAAIPVINALSDVAHPCQAMADLLTLQDEFGEDLRGRTVAFVGDGNNVARSLARICPRFGVRFAHAAPAGYQLETALLEHIRSERPDAEVESTTDPATALDEADAIYTDTFVSMGQEEERWDRLEAFRPYQVNQATLGRAPTHGIVLHCLPAHRGEEITEDVIDGPRSRVFRQAHNRLHAQKGLLATILGSR